MLLLKGELHVRPGKLLFVHSTVIAIGIHIEMFGTAV